MRKTLPIHDIQVEAFKPKLVRWLAKQETAVYLDSNKHPDKYSRYEFIAATGTESQLETSVNCFSSLEKYLEGTDDFLFGFFTYDLKNELENTLSNNPSHMEMPAVFFFQPTLVFTCIRGQKPEIQYPEHMPVKLVEQILQEIKQIKPGKTSRNSCNIQASLDKDEYIQAVIKLQEHIKRGDIYEVNYCLEYQVDNLDIDPGEVFLDIMKSLRPPFSVFFKYNKKYALSASPERFLQKAGDNVISQPMKGTAPRGANLAEDEQHKKNLVESVKERAENIMITDLVRNDLTRSALKNSVKVLELCKVLSYPQAHQMISTISCKIDQSSTLETIKNCFPMGSMTGAPKVKAMELIEEHETFKRGLFSGSIGYFTPEKDFDFNVVIRTIILNTTNKKASVAVGSAITDKSDPMQEYEECLVKAKALLEALASRE